MKQYELTYLISPELSEIDVETFQEKINSLIPEKGGILDENIVPIRKRLAYPIKKRNEAYLGVTVFQLAPENLAELEKNLKADEEILRYLIIAKKAVRVTEKRVRERRLPPSLRKPKEGIFEKSFLRPSEKKVELKEIEKKIDEILNEPQ